MNRNADNRRTERETAAEHNIAEKTGFTDETNDDARQARESVTNMEGHNTDNAIAAGFLDKLEDNQYGTSWKEAANAIETGANMANYPPDDRNQMVEAVIHAFQGMCQGDRPGGHNLIKA